MRDDAASQSLPNLGSHAILPEGVRIYAVGDIHGRADLLEQAFIRIEAHKRVRPIANSIEIYLGDYIDRGPHSRNVLDQMIARATEPNVVALIGNHEEFLLQSLQDGEAFPDWMRYGGRETLLSYGVPAPLEASSRRLEETRRLMKDALPKSHIHFLESRPLSYSYGGFFFVHAGVRPNVALEAQRRSDLLWIRDEFIGWSGALPAIVVHGHTPVRTPRVEPYKINIDTGAYVTGRLTCLVLEGATRAFL
ncbi:metallophosphoesterase family protein [Methylocystis parvus]|uniref:Serine/threonine protein phosphatase n=1 Tax=Methylocystis parvus TaxID=134 RepID=A0A6B8M5G3_9HYPH|nr:metallophosphoesterase family protein [Methylocystis parvus]QGM99224.1 serine/threonine protein phosphatase [Methylocystis parvus]WBK00395.1 serine/threonine protein phosphatase [Methylocystis parvus OBBP]